MYLAIAIRPDHFAVKRLLRYLKSKTDIGLHYKDINNEEFIYGSVDAEWGSNNIATPICANVIRLILLTCQ